MNMKMNLRDIGEIQVLSPSDRSSSEEGLPSSVSEKNVETVEQDEEKIEEDPFEYLFRQFNESLQLRKLSLFKDTVRDPKKLFDLL